MNKREYNKQYHKEFREFAEYKKILNNEILQAYKFHKKFPNWCTPCEDCDNFFCEKPYDNNCRIFWCPDRR